MPRFELEHEPGIPVAYIDLIDERKNSDSKSQVVVEIGKLDFKPTELIFDLNEDGSVIGVELIEL